MTDEEEFALACEEAIAECRRLRYVPQAWIAMVERHGAVDASKKLLVNGDIQTGLLRLLRLGRADLTVEHATLSFESFLPMPRFMSQKPLENLTPRVAKGCNVTTPLGVMSRDVVA